MSISCSHRTQSFHIQGSGQIFFYIDISSSDGIHKHKYAPSLILVILCIRQSLARVWLVAGGALQHSQKQQTQTSTHYEQAAYPGGSIQIQQRHTRVNKYNIYNNSCLNSRQHTSSQMQSFEAGASSRCNVSQSSERNHRSVGFGPFNPTDPQYG